MQKLNLMCPINFTGYGITSFNIYKSLRSKTDICLFPIGGVQLDSNEFEGNIRQDLSKQTDCSNEDHCFKIWHQHDLFTRIGNGKYSALTFFEIDRLRPTEVRGINNLDNIFVASNWAKQVLLDNGVTIPIHISPLGIDPVFFNNEVNKIVNKDKDKYIFLNIGKWEIRKGHDVLLDIFNSAFNEDDNVELWMLNHNPFLNQDGNATWVNLYKNSKLGSKIKIIPRIPSHQDVAKLIALSDCGVFPARAEGWNNEVPEFFALNKPVILTNYSAHTEYANKDNSFLINIDSLIPAIDNQFFDGFGNWADFGENQMEQTVELMRYVYKNNIRTNQAGLETANKLTWSNTGNIIHNKIFE
jgi:glycosyltransferase involved in cell wall biosynthesis